MEPCLVVTGPICWRWPTLIWKVHPRAPHRPTPAPSEQAAAPCTPYMHDIPPLQHPPLHRVARVPLGMELDVLNGATRTLARDRPVFTVEMYPHTKRDASLAAWSLMAVLARP